MLPFFRSRLRLEGIMPERALLKLRRGGISVYKARKTQKNQLLFEVKKKDIRKVFAIYPKLCYNSSTYHPYAVEEIGSVGLAKLTDFCKNRAGALLGGLAFCSLTLALQPMVMGVELVGNPAYKREVLSTLAQEKIRPFAFYEEEKRDILTAKLLTLQGVEFCSVQKVGFWVRVELRAAPFPTLSTHRESMLAARSGEIKSMTVLQGTPLKKAGDSVQAGEPLVGNWLQTEEEEKTEAHPIARVRIACTYEEVFPQVASREEAFAEAYLRLELSEGDVITSKRIEQTESGYRVQMTYEVTESVNL